ncbi:CDK5 and ABL1 enzyme substrate 2 isoform X1 [Falco biarmicus]|uniref:CDK5 and ABL1 enzyme substrate 2 isoform X1 n=1 Tax=Falco cherrug TaxID=345164 RepID=UPI00247ACD55|nr:CDK5 and ABL1 enzyme substrate 2 isoform X1 [Falco cherrug]XP_056209777.1 CDK5 and ABL1 enzyme substrate 2 isoform X1 [Falco biarmicus]
MSAAPLPGSFTFRRDASNERAGSRPRCAPSGPARAAAAHSENGRSHGVRLPASPRAAAAAEAGGLPAAAGRPLLPQQHLPGRPPALPAHREAAAARRPGRGGGSGGGGAGRSPLAAAVPAARLPAAARPAAARRVPAGRRRRSQGGGGPPPRGHLLAAAAAGRPALPAAPRAARPAGDAGGRQAGRPGAAQPHAERGGRRLRAGGAAAEDSGGCAASPSVLGELLARTKHISGSPRHKSLKKMHFIKNMRQYDTKNSRIVLICAKRTLCVAFSILPYGESLRISDLKMEGQKQRHPSGGVSVSTEMVLGLEGVELGADGKVVSYAKFLYPTNALVVRKADSYSAVPSCRASASRSLPGSRYKPVTAKTIPAGTDIGSEAGEAAEYDPNLLDDPQWPCGKHKRVLIFASYMTTVIEYVKPSDLKKDMNETFREKFPHIKLTLSKIRSLKREMRNLSEECNLEPVTVSMAYVYFEKLVLQGKLNKQNRKLCAGACVLLAAKISSDLRKHEVKHLIDKLEERFRFNRRDLIGFEFTVLVALELALYLPENQVLPHYRRLTQQS